MRGVGDIRIESRDIPDPSADEALIRVRAAGICGSDIACYTGRSTEGQFPYTPGHEWAGEVVQVGEQVTTIKKGDRVSGPCEVSCGVCVNCKMGRNPSFCKNPKTYGFHPRYPGAFAEYVTWPEKNLYKLPQGITFEEGALAEPLSVGYHAVNIVGGGLRMGDTALISGAGAIGLMSLVVSKASGASTTIVLDPIAGRREFALKFGADHALDPTSSSGNVVEKITALTGENGVDLAIEASGAESAIPLLLECVRPAGTIVWVGIPPSGKRIPVEAGRIIGRGITLKGSTGNPRSFLPVLQFLARKQVDLKSMITHRFPLEELQGAFDSAINLKDQNNLKTMIVF